MSATRGKIEYRYWVGGTRLYTYKVVAKGPEGFVCLRSPEDSEFLSREGNEFKRTKKEAWAEAAERTKAELAERVPEHRAILKRLGVLERRLKTQQEKAKCTTK